MKYIDADKLKAEITRLKGQLIRGACAAQIELETNCKDEAYNEVLAFLDTLEEELVADDLEEEVKNYFQGYWPGTETAEQCNTDLHFTPPAILRLVHHFAGWQKERGTFVGPIHEKCSQCPYDRDVVFWKGMRHAYDRMKEEAVEGEIVDSGFDDGTAILKAIVPDMRYDRGDKVKLIVIKED